MSNIPDEGLLIWYILQFHEIVFIQIYFITISKQKSIRLAYTSPEKTINIYAK